MKLFEILNAENKKTDEQLKEDLIITRLNDLSLSLEHHTYKTIPGTKNSYRQDSQNTNTKTQKHAHVYAKPNGNGKQLYSVNIDGSGHDGCSGVVIPASHAKHFRELGYEIPDNLTLEGLDYSDLNPDDFEICILEESE